MCKYCERKPVYENGIFVYWLNETRLDNTGIVMGIKEDGRIYLSDYEYATEWYPNFCPVCGRPLRGHRRYTAAIEDAPYGGI